MNPSELPGKIEDGRQKCHSYSWEKETKLSKSHEVLDFLRAQRKTASHMGCKTQGTDFKSQQYS